MLKPIPFPGEPVRPRRISPRPVVRTPPLKEWSPEKKWWERRYEKLNPAIRLLPRAVGGALAGLVETFRPTPLNTGETELLETIGPLLRIEANALPDYPILPEPFHPTVLPDPVEIPIIVRDPVPQALPWVLPPEVFPPPEEWEPVRRARPRRADEVRPWGQPELVPLPKYGFSVGVSQRGQYAGQLTVRASARPYPGTPQNDKKNNSRFLYVAALRFINRTWGPVSEALDWEAAIMRNTYIAGTERSLYGLPLERKWEILLSGEFEVDFNQMMVDLVVMEATDMMIAKLMRGIKETGTLTDVVGPGTRLNYAKGMP